MSALHSFPLARPLLRYQADWRSLFFLIALTFCFTVEWTGFWRNWVLWLLSCFLTIIACNVKHNHMHCRTFHSATLNTLLNHWLGFCTGTTTTEILTEHNERHHGHINGEIDYVRATLVNFRSQVLNVLFFFPRAFVRLKLNKPSDLKRWRRTYELRPSFLDQAIPFIPQTAWIYQSLFFLLPLATFIQPDWVNLRRFALGFCLLVLTFSAIFWIFPTELQAPLPNASSCWGYDHLVAEVDGRRNAFPSLHAALTTFAGVSIIRLFWGKRFACSVTICWILALLISTLTTKQHILLDVLVGAAVGLLTFGLATGDHEHTIKPTLNY